jgi:hypothetical protein
MPLLALLLLTLLPVAAWLWARAHRPANVWLVTGVAYGLVSSLLGLVAYQTFYVSPFALPEKIADLVSVHMLGSFAYPFAIGLGLLPSNRAMTSSDLVWFELLDGVIWAVIFGCCGYLADRARRVRQPRNNAP